MRTPLTQLRTLLARFLDLTVIGLITMLVLDVLWQVASRYVARQPSAWTDELATLLVIWLALLGASAAFGRNAHLGMDFLTQHLSPQQRRITEGLAHLMVAAFAALILILGGIHLVHLTWLTNQVSPALGVKMGHVYLALPISGTFILIFALENLIATLRRKAH
jgi:TRAP-type C4-dicarboxylate transport system permease small subunit